MTSHGKLGQVFLVDERQLHQWLIEVQIARQPWVSTKDGSVPAAGMRDSVPLLLLRTPISKYVRARNRS